MQEIATTKSFSFKEEEKMLELAIIHPILLFVFSDFNFYCYERNLPVVVTSAVRHNIDGVSVSNTHLEGRALDISVKGWSHGDINEAKDHFNEKYKQFAAISASDYKPRLLVYHDVGLGEHLHMQIKHFNRR